MINKITNTPLKGRKVAKPPSKKRNTLVASKKGTTITTKKIVPGLNPGKVITSNGTIQYVLPLGNGWVVKSNRAVNFTAITDSKREAISIARNIARTKKTNLIVHGKNGNVEIQESYAF